MPKKKTTRTHASASLLVELLTEELPPKSLERLSEAFADSILETLKQKHFLTPQSKAEEFATPRRLAVRLSAVLATQPDQVILRKGPSAQAALDSSGQPTQALLGFARSCGVDVSKLGRNKDEKGEYFIYQTQEKGEPLAKHLSGIVEDALKNLPVAKLMRWGSSKTEFVRPVHGLVMLHGNKVVPGNVLGLNSGKTTLGHRFMSHGAVVINHAKDYETILEKKGQVIANPATRAQLIHDQLDRQTKKLGNNAIWSIGKNIELLSEAASLVEYPVVYMGNFDRQFLQIPEECLVISLQQHQRYFPLKESDLSAAKLLPHFLFVSNIKSNTPNNIIRGNERVLRARLADAKFFYDQDRKTRLEERVPQLAKVVYHNKLGTQLDRTKRIQSLAGKIALMLGADAALAERAAWLAKADLLTGMVGEFPELQGVMGRYYALHDGEPNEVADAIEAHYQPRFSGDAVPRNQIGAIVALADKFETLTGLFGIGQLPTGDKDPFALRRHGLGVIRLLSEFELTLDLPTLIQSAINAFPSSLLLDSLEEGGISVPLHVKLKWFLEERAAGYLRERGYSAQETESLFSLANVPSVVLLPAEYISRIEAVRKARSMFPEEFMALATADKRARNILRKSGGQAEVQKADESKLIESAERSLLTKTRELRGQVDELTNAGKFDQALLVTVQISKPVTEFFDSVMVNTEDEDVRVNRFRLLHEVTGLTNRVADISKLAA